METRISPCIRRISESNLSSPVRRASAAATPNPLMVALADDMLGRSGRMVDAIRGIGIGRYTYPNPPYELAVRFR